MIWFYIWLVMMLLVWWGILTTFFDMASDRNIRKPASIVAGVIILLTLAYLFK